MRAPRILIIRLSALGDIIHALPVLAALRQHWPEAYIGWLVEPGGRCLLEGHPLLSRLHVVPKKAMRENILAALRGPMRELTRELRQTRYDVSIDIQGLTKSAAWAWMARIPRRIGFRRPDAREAAPFLNNEKIAPLPPALHVVLRNLALLRPLGIAVDDAERVRFPVCLPETARLRAGAIVGESAAALVVMSLGAGWATKIWPAGRFGELGRRLAERGCRVALAWGPGEESMVGEALAAAGVPAREAGLRADPTEGVSVAASAHADALPAAAGVYPLPATSFVELGAVITRARLFVGGDTGPTHLAAALGTATVSMMGPLDARRNGPYGAHCRTIQHATPHKSPPWRNHRHWCDPATDLRRVTVDEVLAACDQALDR